MSLPCLFAYEEMRTEEPALKTVLVVSELLWRTQCSLYGVLQDGSGRMNAYLCSGCSCRDCGGGRLKAFKDLPPC